MKRMTHEKILEYGKRCRQLADQAYAPYSRFRVASIVLTAQNEYEGVNIENRSYGLTICAERVALFKAISQKDHDLQYIFVYSPDSRFPLPPCGACLQVISEFSRECKVIMFSSSFDYKCLTIQDLYPYDSLHDLKEEGA